MDVLKDIYFHKNFYNKKIVQSNKHTVFKRLSIKLQLM